MDEMQIGVLLPARLETRFVESTCEDEAGQEVACWKLRIAVIPDEPWMNQHSEMISEAEKDSLQRLWETCGDDPETLRSTETGRSAFHTLARQVGAGRAWWLVTQDNAVIGQKPFSRMDSLPEQIEIWLGMRRGQQVDLQRLEPPLTVKREALTFDGTDGSALNLFLNGRWWTREAGLQAEYDLPFTTKSELRNIELIMAVGLGNNSPAELFESHRNAGVLSLLPLGAPTNTLFGEPAADLAQDPDLWWRLISSPAEPETGEDVSLALTGDKGRLKAVPGGTRHHRRLNEGMVNVLWPALWAHTLKDVWCVDREQGWRDMFDTGWRTFSFTLGMWAGKYLHPEGPLAPVRIGDLPYGLWPVTRLKGIAWKPAEDVEASWLLNWLPRTRRQWAAGGRLHSGTVAGVPDHEGNLDGADTDRFVHLLGRVPNSSDYGYRPFLPLQVMHMLSRSLLSNEPEGTVVGHEEWFQRVLEKTEMASGELGFGGRPIRRYITAGWRQDLPLPLVEPPRATHLTSISGGGLLFYNGRTGEGITGRIDGDQFNTVEFLSGFGVWTHIVAVSEDMLFFYNRESGISWVSRVDGEGTYVAIGEVSIGNTSGIRRGWTQITGTPGGGMLFYNAANGRGLPAHFDANGQFQVNPDNLISGFSKDWTHIVSINREQLLFYNAADGRGWCSHLTSNGTYSSIGPIEGIAPGWTHVTGTARGDLLFYNATTGAAATAHLDSAGNFQIVNPSFVTLSGWTHITSTEGGILLFFNALRGEIATGRLDGGDFHFSDHLVEFPGDGKSVFFSQLERIFEIDAEHGVARIFANENCESLIQTDSLLLRLILHSIIRLHAEMGRMHETLDFEGLPFIESFNPGSQCTNLQGWSRNANHLTKDLLFDDGFLHDGFFHQAASPEEIGQWPVVHLYRNLFSTLERWREAYAEAKQRVEKGEAGAVRQLLADMERVFRSTLDTAAVRVDPWITGMAWRRLEALREKGSKDGLGLYAWVDWPYTGTPGPTAGGTLLAPSPAQLLTSVILRDKQINDFQADRWNIELDSQKVRLAKQIAGEVRAGAHIQEVLGRSVEAVIGHKQHIDQLRRCFVIRKEHAGRRICDGQKVLTTPEGRNFLNSLNLQNDQQVALQELRDVIDTYGDLLVADAVHAVVSGRPEKAGEIMEAAAGLELPPKFEVLRTPRSGYSAVTTVWLALPVEEQPDGTNPDTGPAMLADAAVASFLEQSVPVGEWSWQVATAAGLQPVSLTDLGLTVPETLAYSEDSLSQLAIRQVNGTALDDETASPAVAAYRRLRYLVSLFSGHVRDVHNPRDQQQADRWRMHDDELLARLDALRGAAQALVAALDPEQGDLAALNRARRWGISPAPLDDAEAPAEFRRSEAEQLKHRLELAQQGLVDRLARIETVGPGAPIHQVTQAIRELSGNTLPIYGRVGKSWLEEAGELKAHLTLDREWLETMAAVRPNLARVEAHQLDADSPLNTWCNQEDPWTIGDQGDGRVKRPVNVVVCFSPRPTLDNQLAVAVLDSWSEMIPAEPHIVEAAFGFNAPSSRAPQAILLAVPPDESQPLDTETLAHIVLEARETAHARMTTPEDLEPFAALFPLAMVPAQPPTGVDMKLR
jgi:hypothetical protein